MSQQSINLVGLGRARAYLVYLALAAGMLTVLTACGGSTGDNGSKNNGSTGNNANSRNSADSGNSESNKQEIAALLKQNALVDLAVTPDGKKGIAVGRGGTVLWLRDGTWTVASPVGYDYLNSVAMSRSGDEVWVIGKSQDFYYDGKAWQDLRRPTRSLYNVAVGKDGVAWAAGRGVILKGTKGKWQIVDVPTKEVLPPGLQDGLPRFRDVQVTPDGVVWFDNIRDGVLLRYMDGQWSSDMQAWKLWQKTGLNGGCVSMVSKREGWAFSSSDEGRAYHIKDDMWEPVPSGEGPVGCPYLNEEGNAGWSIGTKGKAARLQGSTWNAASVPTEHINSVAVVSANEAWAAGGDLNIGSGTSGGEGFILHWDGKEWNDWTTERGR